jgi:hypothetical protein
MIYSTRSTFVRQMASSAISDQDIQNISLEDNSSSNLESSIVNTIERLHDQ